MRVLLTGANGFIEIAARLPADGHEVAVSETRLSTEKDSVLVPSIHMLIVDHPKTFEAVVRFKEGGTCGGGG